ncbi:MAG: M56 family metallopeptidase [Oscillospiraceae bacterium]|nr:M56 family metallopeptidase [Oscillospiraceae bacterium]
MQAVFAKILNMSLTGSIVIAVVLLTRLFLKRAPKIYSYALWAVVLFRLLCPLSITAGLSVLKPIPVDTTPGISAVSYQPVAQAVRENIPVPIRQQFVPAQPAEQLEQPETKLPPMQAAAYIWLAGASVMAVYSIAQYLILRRKLAEAVPLKENVYLADRISTPFVMGVIRPRVYLPSGTPGEERDFILAHEEHHIRRGDPVWKLLGYAALCLHWFNPLVWLAFCLSGKDMEMSCDEAVIKSLGEDIRADYAQALLRLATHKRIVSGMPLAFGEGDTKGRVMNMAKWKKPKVWVSVLCVALCLVILAACALNPKQEEKPLEDLTRIEGPAGIGAWELYFKLPEGCTEEMQEKGDKNWKDSRDGCVIVLTDGENTIGGVMAFPIPDNFSADNWDWLHELDLPEWQDDTLGYSAGGAPGVEVSVEFFSDVPDGQERTVLNEHNLYFYEGWIYDLWFDKLLAKPETMAAILDTVSLGEPKTNPTTLPYEIGELPLGYDAMVTAEGNILIDNLRGKVGLITSYPIPEGVYDPYDDGFLWMEDVGVEDLENPNLMVTGMFSWGGRNGCTLTVADDPEHPTVERTHYFRFTENTLYDFWLDDLAVDEVTRAAIQEAVVYQEPATQQKELTFYLEGMEEKAMATLYAGDGYSLYIIDEGWVNFLDDGQPVWESRLNPDVKLGVIHLTDMPLSAAQGWVRHKFEGFDLIEDKQGGLGGTNAEGILADVRLIPSGEDTYAVCCVYPMEAAEGFGVRLAVMADTFALTSPAATPELSEEEIAFSKAQGVIMGLQDVPCLIQTECRYQNTPEKDFIETFCCDSELGLLRVTTTADGLDHAQLYVNDHYYTNAGSETSPEPVWVESEAPSEFSVPWLASFHFIRHYVTYVDTLSDGEKASYLFRVNAPFADTQDATDHYFATFHFDAEDRFMDVSLQINPVRDDAYTRRESIVSLNQQTVSETILAEFARATNTSATAIG